MTDSNFAGEPMIGRHADLDAREDNGNNESVIDVPSDDRVDSAHDDSQNASPAEPVEHATFAAETDPTTATVPNDPAPEVETVADESAAFAAVDSTSSGVEPTASDSDDFDKRISTSDGLDREPLSNVDSDVSVTEPVGLDDDVWDSSTGLSKGDREILEFVHENLIVILKDINSLKVLVADIGPTLNALVEEAKAKGLAGLLPLIMSSMKK